MFSSFAKTALRVSSRINGSQLNAVNIRCFSKMSGQVKWFDSKKGFGFIVPDDESGDVFVHQTSIHAEGFRSLAEGEHVEFNTIVDERGRRKADLVTGPMGAFVQGAPRPSFQDNSSGFGGFNDSGFGSGFGSSSNTDEFDDDFVIDSDEPTPFDDGFGDEKASDEEVKDETK